MTKIQFKRIVLKATSDLIQAGYEYDSIHTNSQSVYFRKLINEEVECLVDFQLRQHFRPPKREFKVNLWRDWITDQASIPTTYAPVVVGLTNLMRFAYGKEVTPLGKFWEFSNEEELYDRIKHAQAILIEYGIPWLENPHTTSTWRKSS